MATQQDLQILESKLTKLHQYSGRRKPMISLQQLPTTNIDQFVSYINTEIQRQSYLVDHLIGEFSTIITSMCHRAQEQTGRYDELVKQHEGTLAKVQEYKEMLGAKDKQFINLQIVNKSLEAELQQCKIQLQNLQAQFTQELEPIKQTLLDQQFKAQRNLEFVSEIREENQTINKVMRETYNQKNQLKDQIARLSEKVNELQENLMKVIDKLTLETKRRQNVQQILDNKEKEIKQLECEIIELKEQAKIPFGKNFNYELFSPPQDSEQEPYYSPKQEKVKLSEDVQNRSLENKLEMEMLILNKNGSMKNIQNNEEMVMKQAGNLSDLHMDKTISQTPCKSTMTSKIRKSLILDPYYCHYVLLSQTIKVQQNQQEFFNIDIKPFYKQIINEKVPMFEWKQWILNKFIQIAGVQNLSPGISPRKL